MQPYTFNKIIAAYETWRNRGQGPRADATLSRVSGTGPATSGVIVVVVTRNDVRMWPFFLKHYRALGVDRFVVVDDQSTDGTKELLGEQKDVDLWVSDIRFKEAHRGKLWRETLMSIYGLNRWYLSLDSDEFLVFDQCERRTIPELTAVLERAGQRRLPAPMIDMYPGKDVDAAADFEKPWSFASLLDSEGYQARAKKRALSLRGGPRARLYGEDAELMKYPLTFWTSKSGYGSSIHQPLPYQWNFGKYSGALLHLKFFTDYKDKIRAAAEEKQHFNQSAHYQTMAQQISKQGRLDFEYSGSMVYEGPEQLQRLGLITKMPF